MDRTERIAQLQKRITTIRFALVDLEAELEYALDMLEDFASKTPKNGAVDDLLAAWQKAQSNRALGLKNTILSVENVVDDLESGLAYQTETLREEESAKNDLSDTWGGTWGQVRENPVSIPVNKRKILTASEEKLFSIMDLKLEQISGTRFKLSELVLSTGLDPEVIMEIADRYPNLVGHRITHTGEMQYWLMVRLSRWLKLETH